MKITKILFFCKTLDIKCFFVKTNTLIINTLAQNKVYTRKCLTLSFACLFFLALISCNNQSEQNEYLLKTWKLNGAKEGKSALFTSKEGTTFRFLNENKLEIKRTYRGKAEYLRGKWEMDNSKMNLQLVESENVRVIYDLGTKDTSEEQFMAKNPTNIQVVLEIEKLEKFVLKLKNDSLQYILVPNF